MQFCTSENVMNHNLVTPYNEKASPPQTPYLSFYSPQSFDLLFTSASLNDEQPNLSIICQSGLRSVGLKWSLHRNMVKQPFRQGEAEALPANQFRIEIEPEALSAGFYNLRVTLDTGMPQPEGKPITGICTFGWNAEEMAIRETLPTDFKEFWDKAKAELAAIPLDVRQETPMQRFNREEIGEYNLKSACLPADYDPTGHKFEEVESYKISIASPDGGRIYAWLAKPLGDGPFPAMLVLPGAGFAARPRPLEHARHGYLAIDIQIHGQDVDLPDYPQLTTDYDETKPAPTGHYYYNVHLRVLQTINYLVSRDDVDAERIVVVGGSQGGRLGVIAAGLDSRVKALVSCIINSPNYPHLRWVTQTNEQQEDGIELTDAPPALDDFAAQTFAYFDPMNYAPHIKCPVFMNAGLIDAVSPPFSVWAVYNRLGTDDKSIVPLAGLAHDWSAEFDRRAWKWLEAKLNS